MKERVTFPQDFWEHGKFFFIAPSQFDEQTITKKWNDDAVKFLSTYKDELKTLTSIDSITAKSILEKVSVSTRIGSGKIMQMLRIALTGGASGPDLMMTMEIIGKDESVNRITYALENFKVKIS